MRLRLNLSRSIGEMMANPKKEIENTDARDARIASVDMKLEIVVIPVSDVDRAKEFYRRLVSRCTQFPESRFFVFNTFRDLRAWLLH